MKKLLVSALIVCSVFTAKAGENEEKTAVAKIKVTTNVTDKKAHLTFIPSSEEKVIVKILDEKGTPIFQEQIQQSEGFTRPYNLSKLNGTEFTFVVKEGKNTYEEKISLSEINSVEVNFYATARTLENNKIELKVLKNEVGPVTVIVKDQNGNALYSNTVADLISFVQNYDVAQVKGELTIEVISGTAKKTIIL